MSTNVGNNCSKSITLDYHQKKKKRTSKTQQKVPNNYQTTKIVENYLITNHKLITLKAHKVEKQHLFNSKVVNILFVVFWVGEFTVSSFFLSVGNRMYLTSHNYENYNF